MATYHLAPALAALRTEVNARWPRRDRTSDGWIGDTAHSARVSDHNPDWRAGGVVRALDIDVDGIDVAALKAAVRHDPRTEYMIHAAQIEQRKYGFKPRRYTGPNKHHSHIHISIRHGATFERDGRPWGIAATAVAGATSPVQEDDMPLSNDDLIKILDARFKIAPDREVSVREALTATYFYGDRINALLTNIEGRVGQLPAQVWSHPLPRTVGDGDVSTGDLLRYESAEHANTRAVVEAVVKAAPGADVDAITQAVRDALANGIQLHVTTGGAP